jgi:hypothetical protein
MTGRSSTVSEDLDFVIPMGADTPRSQRSKKALRLKETLAALLIGVGQRGAARRLHSFHSPETNISRLRRSAGRDCC